MITLKFNSVVAEARMKRITVADMRYERNAELYFELENLGIFVLKV